MMMCIDLQQCAAMESDGLKALVCAKALEHGFELCCFTRPEVREPHLSAYQAWMADGMYGDMDWMAEESRVARRKQPVSMLDDVQTVITVGMCHTPPPYSLERSESEQDRGVIASYAHGDDYHEVVKKCLKALAHDLDVLLGAHKQRVYVDTAPVLEHALAENAGLGWQGKHSLTIHKKLGSWMILGEVFTTAEIEPDTPANNHCGTCTACMDVCPTKAIVAPYVVDARLCISYLTIEFDGFIPHELRLLMGNHIFGCDDCQMICPWNSHVVAPDSDLLAPRKENLLPNLSNLLQLDDQAFLQRFRKSPIKRTGRAGLLRNVCIAMGNSGNADFVPVLMKALTDEAALIRGHAAWALGQLADKTDSRQIKVLLKQIKHQEDNENVLEEISLSVEYIGINNE